MSYDIFCKYYDELMFDAEYEKRASYFDKIITGYLPGKGILLDAGCGTGTISVKMAELGYDVIGIDPSVGMLMQAKQKVYESGKEILLLNQSMEELDLYGTVDCAISCLDCINHLDGPENVKKAFSNISLFMNPEGIFVFDVNTIYKHKNILANNAYVIDTENIFCSWQNNLNDDNSVNVCLDFFELQDDNSYMRYSESFTEKVYALDEITCWLNEAGFDVKAIYNDLTFDKVNDKSEKALFVAEKR